MGGFFFLHPYCCLQQFSDLPCAVTSLPGKPAPNPALQHCCKGTLLHTCYLLGQMYSLCVELMPKCFILYFHPLFSHLLL